jgi:hypothetical protein
MRFHWILLQLAGTYFLSIAHGQQPGATSRKEYIQKYKDLAIAEMKRAGIPASITMAQACLESGDGNSRLAVKANNHFGIKCHEDWKGKKIYHDDDEKNECFRKYPSVIDSYRDHSDYLMDKSRYDFLFDLNPTDYEAWAKGLKKAGYATSPTYASALIKIIEDFQLYELDKAAAGKEHPGKKHKTAKDTAVIGRKIYERNRIQYILCRKGDSFENLTLEFGKLPWELPRYNDLPANAALDSNQLVYLQPKRNAAEPGKRTHALKEGETLHEVSQLYGIKLDKLTEKNQLPADSIPPAGTVLQLRKSVKPVKIGLSPQEKEPLKDEEEDLIFEMDEN